MLGLLNLFGNGAVSTDEYRVEERILMDVHPLHPPPSTRHPTPYTLHPTPYTLHTTPYTHTLHHELGRSQDVC